jgi:hypothetical protein
VPPPPPPAAIPMATLAQQGRKKQPKYMKRLVFPILTGVVLLLFKLVVWHGSGDTRTPPAPEEHHRPTPAVQEIHRGQDDRPTPPPQEIHQSQDGEVRCPICGEKMVVKKGKYGKFYSCIRFPACRGSRDYP